MRAVTLSELETRVAELKKRLRELTTQLKSPGNKSTDADKQSITVQAKRLAKLEERHENLLRHTPQAREREEEPDLFGYIVLMVIVAVAIYII